MNFINTASEFHSMGRYPETHRDKKHLIEVTYRRNGCSEFTVSGGSQSIPAGRQTGRCSPVFGQVEGREPAVSACSCDGDGKQRQRPETEVGVHAQGSPQASYFYQPGPSF